MVKGYKKQCVQCGDIYLAGKGKTKLWIIEEDRYIHYSDIASVPFEGIEEYEMKGYVLLFFCCKNCFNLWKEAERRIE